MEIMESYKLAAVLLLVFTVPSVTGEINFRSDQPVDFYNDVNLNGNTLSNLSAPEDNLDAVRRQELTQMLNRTDGTLAGNLNFNGNNAELNDGYISNDGDDEGIRVLDSGEVTIENGILDLSGNSLTGLPASDDSNDAVRQDQLSNYVKLNGDTLEGNLSFDDSYYITDLPEPENPEDAATKSFVELYSDTNDNVISDDQDLSVSTDPSNGGQTTIDITNGSSATFTDDYAADDQNLGTSGNQITLDNSGSITAPYSDNSDQLDGNQPSELNWNNLGIDENDVSVSNLGKADTNIDMNGYNITSSGGEFCVGQYC